ncbi:glycosyltransferase [Shewanella xiamenensis]|uniref:glycosyltransferase family 2 protein n=1 Tax=Shewanella xiamenensis TaxID=332186 RepID=UPI00244B4200|nr:glycosyltransferase [Shewanella xiamenensis]MDH1314313.1 glycosyltransferase [Shewanella xiamenensis]
MIISVLIPVFNVENFLIESVNSIFLQKKIICDWQLEVIIVDDCSTDRTYDIALELATRYDKIKVYRNEVNSKICKTLNFALQNANGDFILRIDGDDIALPTRIETQLSFLIEKKLDLVGCQMISISESGLEISKGFMPVGIEKIKVSSKYASPIAHIWLAKREIYESLNGYRNIPYAEDYDFILRALDMGYCCDNHSEYLMLIRQREGNTASTASLKQRKTHRYVLELHKRRVANNSNDDGFSEDELAKKIKSWPLTEILHIYSTNMLSSAYTDKNVFRKTFKIILSCLLSYYNFEYLISRMMFKRTFM